MSKQATETVNPHLRQLRIAMITGNSTPIMEWFNGLWKQLKVVETNVYGSKGGEFIYYINTTTDEREVVFYHNSNGETFWCNHPLYWEILHDTFGIGYKPAQEITKMLMDDVLNTSIAPPSYPFDYHLAHKALGAIVEVKPFPQIMSTLLKKVFGR